MIVISVVAVVFLLIYWNRKNLPRGLKLLVIILCSLAAATISYATFAELSRVYMVILLAVVVVALGTRPIISYIFSVFASFYGMLLTANSDKLLLDSPVFLLSLAIFLLISYTISSQMIGHVSKANNTERLLIRTDTASGLINEFGLREHLNKVLADEPTVTRRLYQLQFGCLTSVQVDFSRDVRDELQHQIGLMFKLHFHSSVNFGRLNDGGFLFIAERFQWKDCESYFRSLSDESLEVNGYKIMLNPTLVTTDAPIDGNTTEQLLDNLSRVSLRAKSEKVHFARFTPVDVNTEVVTHYYVGELKAAIEKHQLKLFLQPKVVAGIKGTNRIKGAEALIRWQHPEKGLLFPGSFLDQVENSTARVRLALFVIDQSAELLFEAHKIDPDFQLSFNLNPSDLRELRVIAQLARVMKTYDFPPRSLQIEVTETETAMHVDNLTRSLIAVRGLGYSIAMDDFGTGMSSLSYFSKLPIDTVKIDRAFLESIEESETARYVLKSMINLCQGVDWRVVIEGVETEFQASTVSEMGSDLIQGYLFGRPVDSETFFATLAQQAERENQSSH